MNWFRGNRMPPIQTDVMTQNVILGLSVLSPWRYVFISQKAYQESETRPESSVYTLMKGTAVHGDDILDTVEYARPSEVSAERTLQHRQGCFTFLTLTAAFFLQGGDVISTILRREVTYDQSQGTCAEVRGHQKALQTRKHPFSLTTEHLFYFTSAFQCRQCQLYERLWLRPGRGGLWRPWYCFLFLTKSFFELVWFVFHHTSVFNIIFLQAEERADAFSTTTTPSKPVRSKAGVLLRSTL